MIYVQINEGLQPEAGAGPGLEKLLARAAKAALESSGGDLQADLTLVISDDAQLQELNRQFLGIDAVTDVLSFPGGETDPDSEALYLGDVIISLPQARRQAEAGGHPVEDELQLLVVHGVLHLLGHDHAEEDEKARMWAVQARALERLGVRLRP